MASSQALFISCALSFMNLLTSVLRSRSTTLLVGNKPIALKISPSFRAIVVLPVPGLPVRIICTGVSSALPIPAAILMRSICILLASSRTCFFMLSIPTNASSSANTWSTPLSSSSLQMSSLVIMQFCCIAACGSTFCSSNSRCACSFFALSKTFLTSRALPNLAPRIKYIFLK